MKRVLSVDDSSSIRQMVSFTLRGAGYEVAEAVDGIDGLAKAGNGRFDLIVTDLNMPHMSGSEFLSVVRVRFPTRGGRSFERCSARLA